MINNMFYFANINSIGGVETFFYNIAKKYSDLDVVIYYKTGDLVQLKRLSDYVRVVKYNGEKIECKKAFFNYNLEIIDNVEAEEYIQIIHADYKAMKAYFKPDPKITRYIGVSKTACKSFKELTGIDIELAYNPYVKADPNKALILISATRLTNEKGKSRIDKLAKIFDAYGVPYIWFVFTNDKNAINNPNIVYMPPKLNILDYISKADYLVQLSDNEAYCYSVVEALSIGVPVIVTDCPVFKEIGVKDGTNGFVLDFDLKNVPVNKIREGLESFEYEPLEDTWINILEPGDSTYKKDLEELVKVQTKRFYYDLALQRQLSSHEIVLMTKARAMQLADSGFVDILKK